MHCPTSCPSPPPFLYVLAGFHLTPRTSPISRSYMALWGSLNPRRIVIVSVGVKERVLIQRLTCRSTVVPICSRARSSFVWYQCHRGAARLVKENHLHEGWDEEFQCHVLDEDKVPCSSVGRGSSPTVASAYGGEKVALSCDFTEA